jgi:small conductance mechanosensitive channel
MRVLFCIFIFFAFLYAAPAMAAPAAAAPHTGATVSTENLKTLLGTLKNDAEREKFIGKLDALVKAQEEAGGTLHKQPSNLIGFDKWGAELQQRYSDFLMDYGLTENMAGKFILTFITVPAAFLLAALIKKLSLVLAAKLELLRARYGLTHHRFRFYARILRYVGYAFVFFLFTYLQLAIWNFFPLSFISSEQFGALGSLLLNVALTLMLAVVVCEALNGLVEYGLRRSRTGQSARLHTLLPLIRSVLFGTVMAMFTLVLLSQFGIDILPLLAGVGVIGVAIGFGAQSMVKDFLTGFSIILGDFILVNDLVTVAGRTGFVEKVAVSSVTLRGWDGTVYTIPFSEITTIENMSRYYSYYLMDIAVAWQQDTDKVESILREVDEELRADGHFGKLILAPIEIFGVDRFAGGTVFIRARIKTLPMRQWEEGPGDVGREFNRRMQRAFIANNILMPAHSQTVYLGEKRSAPAPELRARPADGA